MSYNENWPRWVVASLNKHFDSQKASFALFIEGEERKTNQLQQYLELRIDGPDLEIQASGDYRLHVVVNILCQCFVGRDLYLLEKLIGTASKAFFLQIPVFEFGDAPSVQIGCLQLVSDTLLVHRYGQVRTDNKVLQATVEGRYAIDL